MAENASAVNVPSNGFQLSSLWLDQKYRSITLQVIAAVLLLSFIGMIVNNTMSNLKILGINPGYDFLGDPSSYDISQHLIEYNSTSPHWKAGVVGLLNTLLVALFGVVTATIIGFVVGVFRLSKNWLISRISYVYIELTRNVPLLLQILLWYGITVHSLPKPKQALEPATNFFLSNRGLFMPKPVFESAMWLVVAAFIVAVVAAIWYSKRAHKLQDETGKISPVFTVGASLIVGLPLVAFFVSGMPVSFDIPELKGFNYKGGMAIKPEFMALWFALSMYTGAFIAEIVRAGIVSISHGQTEASYSLGIKSSWTMRLVVLPQALRVIIPPLISQYLNLTKNSSLAIAVGYMDVVATLGGITLNQTGRALECMSIVLTTYLVISLSISAVMNWYNKRVALVER